MIGAPTLDPRQGDRRKKALQAALERQASAISRFGRTGVGRGAVSGFGRRPVSTGGRPSGILNFLNRGGHAPQGFANGLSMFNGESGGLGPLVAATQLPSAPLPGSVSGGGGVQGGSTVGSDPQAVADQLNTEGNTGAYVTPSGSVFEGQLSYDSSGLIPLGGGIFLDPNTGGVIGGPSSHITGLQEGM